MKKIVSCLLLLILTLSLVVGCNGETPQEGTDVNKTVMTVGSFAVTAKEYNYAYYTTVQEFCSIYQGYLTYFGLDLNTSLKEQKCAISETEQTWAEFFMEQTEDILTQVYSFYNAAVAEKMELKEEYRLQMDAYLLSLTEVAKKVNKTNDAYLSENFGSGLTEQDYKIYMERRLLATQYCDEKLGAIVYTDADYETYYQANKESVDRINFRFYTLNESFLTEDASQSEDTTDAAVKARAELFAKDLTSEELFVQRALEFAPESEKKNYESSAATLAQNVDADDLAESDMKTWLFDTARKPGDVSVHKTSTATYTVCYFISRQRDENQMVSMRHILLEVDESKEGKTDAEVSAAIQKIYDDWKAAGSKESDFITIASEKTEDPGSKENGGLYDFFNKGTMVSEIEDWLYAEGRQMNDTTIIKTSYGYHIVMFKGYGDLGWKAACLAGMENASYNNLLENLKKVNAVTFEENHRDAVGNDY